MTTQPTAIDMSATSDSNADFAYQLECQSKESSDDHTASASSIKSNRYTDPSDGTIYEWDAARSAWFPQVSEDFIARYQEQYGVSEGQPHTSTSSSTAEMTTPSDVVHIASGAARSSADASTSQMLDDKSAASKKATSKKKAFVRDDTWFNIDDQHNKNVYVSNLPIDISEEEFAAHMGKAGLILKDPRTDRLKVKLYKDDSGVNKGDGLCSYIKIESVDLALNILDESLLGDNKIGVKRAEFQVKGAFDPQKRRIHRLRAQDKKKIKKQEERLLAWVPDKLRGERAKCEKTVVLRNVFDLQEFDADLSLITEYEKDIREECAKFGIVRKVTIYDKNPAGIVTVTFSTAEEADACIARMAGRWFSQRQLLAEPWDGRAKFLVVETEEEKMARIAKWEKSLESEDVTTTV